MRSENRTQIELSAPISGSLEISESTLLMQKGFDWERARDKENHETGSRVAGESGDSTPVFRKRRRSMEQKGKPGAYPEDPRRRHSSAPEPEGLECTESLDMEESSIPDSPVKNQRSTSKYIADPRAVIEMDDNPDMFDWMLKREKYYQPPPYMSLQTFVDNNMRSILFDWMMEVSQEFTLGREAMHLAANYVDRFLCRVNANISLAPMSDEEVEDIGRLTPITRSNLQLLGVASLFIASKLEEIYPPNASEWSVTTDGGFSVAQIDAMERMILKVLNWNLNAQTPYSWLKVYIKKCCKLLHESIQTSAIHPSPDKKMKVDLTESPKRISVSDLGDLGLGSSSSSSSSSGSGSNNYPLHVNEKLLLIDTLLSVKVFVRMMELLDMTMLDSYFLRFYPSAIAASAICVVIPQARFLIREATGYTTESLKPCILLLNVFTILPYQGLVLPSKPYFSSKTFTEEPYTRQTHHAKSLELIHELISRGYTEEEELQPHFSDTPSTTFLSHSTTDVSLTSSTDLSADFSVDSSHDSSFNSPNRMSISRGVDTPSSTHSSPMLSIPMASDNSPMKPATPIKTVKTKKITNHHHPSTTITTTTKSKSRVKTRRKGRGSGPPQEGGSGRGQGILQPRQMIKDQVLTEDVVR